MDMNIIYRYIMHYLFTKDLDIVLSNLNRVTTNLQKVQKQQSGIAYDADVAIAAATVARDEADAAQARALRVEAKISDLLS